jgi:predicted O-methyltransferase YrrM
VKPSFLQRYLQAFPRIEGWFQFDAALLFIAATQKLPRGDTLEIGVHHGLSAIAVAALRGPGKRFVAVDLFEEMQDRNVSASGAGHRATFEKNMREFHPDLSFLEVLTRASGELKSEELGGGFSFCHIDGGHSREETAADLRLCHSILMPGGLVVVDDYFNPAFPGVVEGVAQFMFECGRPVTPVAIGYGKVILQKPPVQPLELPFRRLERTLVRMWDAETVLFAGILRDHVDLYGSSPEALMPRGTVRAELVASQPALRIKCGRTAQLKVRVVNRSGEPFPGGKQVFGVSWHLLSPSGEVLQHDNPRAWLTEPLQPGASAEVELKIAAPDTKGAYVAELDLVWERVMWFKDVGNPAPRVDLLVS